jgi:RNA polymerase sigma-70 factor (ECF subfamily)
MNTEQRDVACDRAYRDHAADLYRVCFGILRNPDEALDATNDAFARAWERWEQYDSQRPLRPWLHGIAVNICLDRLRRWRVRSIARASAPVALGATVTADPANEIVSRRVVEQAMADLRPEARAALVLRHYYGYEYAQIGEILHMPAGSVGSLLSRSHVALRQRLAEFAPRSSASVPRATSTPPISEGNTTTESPEALP